MVKDRRGNAHRVYICHLTPLYEVETVEGWKQEADAMALDVLQRRLRAIPSGHSSDPHERIAVQDWNTMLMVLRRNGRDLPPAVLREARVAGVLEDSV